jgi:hypothetical protein
MAEAEPQAERAAAQSLTAEQALARAEAAFAAGDHARLRAALAELERSDSAEARARGAQLARAIGVDPALIAVLLACLVGFAFVFVRYVL